MKKILFLALCFIAVSATTKAQDTTTPKSFIDTVKGAILIQPIVINAMAKDTAYQLTWTAFDVTRAENAGCNTYVQIFDRSGKKLSDFNCPIPAAIVKQWGTSDTIIDDYILSTYGLKLKK